MLYVTVHAQLCASRHITCLCLPLWRLFGKEGILQLPLRRTRQQTAAFNLLQICRLFYLKAASVRKVSLWEKPPRATISSTSIPIRPTPGHYLPLPLGLQCHLLLCLQGLKRTRCWIKCSWSTNKRERSSQGYSVQSLHTVGSLLWKVVEPTELLQYVHCYKSSKNENIFFCQ